MDLNQRIRQLMSINQLFANFSPPSRFLSIILQMSNNGNTMPIEDLSVIHDCVSQINMSEHSKNNSIGRNQAASDFKGTMALLCVDLHFVSAHSGRCGTVTCHVVCHV